MLKAAYTVLLIGGISSGKTFVSDYLASLGANIIDTDQINRQLTVLNGAIESKAVLCALQQLFGKQVVNDQLVLDRRVLQQQIFTNHEQRTQLEAVLHPRIYAEVEHRILANDNKNYNVIVVPVIRSDSVYFKLAASILAIEVPVEVQLTRVMARDNISQALAKRIIASQVTNLERRGYANNIIINTCRAHTQRTLLRLHQRYMNKINQ